MIVKTSAPGKLMLLGEHAVVYGYPCIVTAVNKRLYVEAEIIDKKKDEIITPQVKECRFVSESIRDFKKKFKIKKSIRIATLGDFSHNVGLGSSSAVTVATFQALSVLFNKKLSKREIFNLSYKVNLDIQGVGSGFDLASATFGKTLYFISGGKTIDILDLKNIPLVVGYSGVKADTPKIVQSLKQKMKNQDARINIFNTFTAIKDLVEKGKTALLKNDWETLGQMMSSNQKYLQKLGVSTKKLDRMVDVSRKAGAYGAKLSGAGGGDCMIALIKEEDRENVENAIRTVGGEIIKVENNSEGVRIENETKFKVDDQDEIFVVVDKDDKIINYKTRYLCHHDKRLIHRAVGIVIFNKKGQILLQKRSKYKDTFPGFYTLSVSGHVEKEESYLDSAKREIFEEIGIKIPLKYVTKFLHQDNIETEFNALFTAEYDGPFKINSREIDDLKFMSPDDIKKNSKKMTPFTIASFKRLKII